MNLQKPTQSRLAHCVFVLWGDHFAEDVATIFATELRRAGLHVKIVGLRGLQASGIHGVVLATDLALGQALPLTKKTTALVIPCNVTILQRAEDDPRLRDFFKQAIRDNVRLIVECPEVVERSSLQDLPISPSQLAYYSTATDLIEFARTTAVSLAGLVAV